jgi:HK97 family phage portal protein
MALKLFERFKVAKQVMQTGKLPFVQILGYEKSYGQPTPQDFNRLITEYKSWSYACATRNAFSVAKCALNIYSKNANGELEQINEHPFLDLMQNVNPFFNKFELWTLTIIYLEMTGNNYWWIPKGTLGIPTSIWNIPSQWMKIIPDEKEFIAGYIMMMPNKGIRVPFEKEEIVHFKYPNPFDLFYGLAPAWAAQYGIDMNNQLKTWGINYFMNNAQPSGVLSTEQSLSDDSYRRLRDEWNRKYRGAENAGKMAILESGLKYQQTGTSMKDAKFEETSREPRDEIFSIFGVPASKLGLVEDVNRANAEANDYTYQKETVLPRLLLIEEKLNEKVMPMYDENLICKF